MNYTIYLDVLFLVNFGMDYLILWLTGRLCHQQIPWWRYLISALTGSFLLLLIIWLPIPEAWIYYICSYGIIGILMCYLAFRPKGLKAVITCYLCQLLVTFLLGGIMNWLYFSSPVQHWMNGLWDKETGIQLREFMLLLFLAGAIFSILTAGFRQYRKEERQNLYDLSLYFGEQNIYGIGLLDTGNFLIDPMTRQPVIVADARWIKKLLPEEYQSLLVTYLELGKIDYDRIAEERLLKAKWIPFQAVGEEQGQLLGIQCGKLVLKGRDTCITRQNVIVGISRTPISKNNRYQMLLHTDIIEQEEYICCR